MRIAITLLGCALLACRPPVGAAPAVPAPPRAGGQTLFVGLDRDICFGTCPAYKIEIDRDGAVRYTGRADVCEPGPISGRLSDDQMNKLRTAISTSGFAAIPEHCCDCPVSDTPTITLTVGDPPPLKTVVDSYGCEGGTTPVEALADTIDRIVGIERWIGTKEERKNCQW